MGALSWTQAKSIFYDVVVEHEEFIYVYHNISKLILYLNNHNISYDDVGFLHITYRERLREEKWNLK